MTKVIIFALLMIVAVAVMGAPADMYEPLEFEIEQPEEVVEHLRFRRVTCDLLSVNGFLGDSACAANCLSMGKAGGRCNGGICQCRQTTFNDLWKKRFGH